MAFQVIRGASQDCLVPVVEVNPRRRRAAPGTPRPEVTQDWRPKNIAVWRLRQVGRLLLPPNPVLWALGPATASVRRRARQPAAIVVAIHHERGGELS